MMSALARRRFFRPQNNLVLTRLFSSRADPFVFDGLQIAKEQLRETLDSIEPLAA